MEVRDELVDSVKWDSEKKPQSHLQGYHSEVHQHALDAEGFMQRIIILLQLMLSVEETEYIDIVTQNPGDIIRVQRCIWRA